MSDWDLYNEIVEAVGTSRRDRIISTARDAFERRYAPDHPSFATCYIDGTPVDMLIMAADDADQKKFRAMPSDNDKVTYGDIVEWAGSHWIVIQSDFDDTVSRRGYMQYCNHLFKFQARDGRIIERWGVLDSGVYSTTIKNTMAMPELNTQYKVYLPYDEDTKHLFIDQRFAGGTMYDKHDNEVMVVYKFTKYDPLTSNQGDGRLLIMHCAADAYDPQRDNIELGICDYIDPEAPPVAYDWKIEPVSSPDPVAGGVPVYYKCIAGEDELPLDLKWTLTGVETNGCSLEQYADGMCSVAADRNALLGSLLILTASSDSAGKESRTTLEVVSIY